MSQAYNAGQTVLGIAVVGVLIGLAEMPYAYFRLLRLILCGASLFYLNVGARLTDGHKALLIGFAILYNPVIPVYLHDKSLWILLNIATVSFFWWVDQRSRSLR